MTIRHCARTDKVPLRWRVTRSFAQRRKPQGKGGGPRTGLAVQAAPVAQPPGQCPDLTRRKSGKKSTIPVHCLNRPRIMSFVPGTAALNNRQKPPSFAKGKADKGPGMKSPKLKIAVGVILALVMALPLVG